jgi:hypothetical protein
VWSALGENPAGHSVALLMLNKKFALQVGGDGVVLAGNAGVVLADSTEEHGADSAIAAVPRMDSP